MRTLRSSFGSFRRLLLAAAPVGAAALLAACGGEPAEGGDGDRSALPAPVSTATVRWTLRTGEQSPVSLRTLPGATCSLHAAGAEDGEGLELLADSHGNVRFHLSPRTDSDEVAELALDCRSGGGGSTTQAIEVRASADAPVAHGEVDPGSRRLDDDRIVLPALTEDPAALRDDELAGRGYPPRPDAATAPSAYATWLRAVSKPLTVVRPELVERRDRTHGALQRTVDAPPSADATSTSGNWSGFVISKPSTYYNSVTGTWTVPYVYPEAGFYYLNNSSFWVGLDGFATNDLVQAGTRQDTQTIFGVQASSYYAWAEFFPAYEQAISNFRVNPGDTIWTYVLVGNAGGSSSTYGGYGWFEMWNETEGEFVYFGIQAPSGTGFNGYSAEWIMEAPLSPGQTGLANYVTAQMSGAEAGATDGRTHGWTTDPFWQVTLVSNRPVSEATVLNSQSFVWFWLNYN